MGDEIAGQETTHGKESNPDDGSGHAFAARHR